MWGQRHAPQDMRPHRQQLGLPKATSVRKVYRQKLTFGCPVLDRLLGGGVPCGLITELTGEAAAGKTNACLQLLLTAQLPLKQGGFDGCAMYVYTEGNAPLQRLQQLAEARGNPNALQQIVVAQNGIDNGWGLLEKLQQAESMLATPPHDKSFRLLIVDSVAAVFRDVGDDPGVAQYAQRSSLFFQIAALLRRYAEAYNLAVVVTNQVTDFFEDGDDAADRKACTTAGLDLWTDERQVLPALGLAWSSCVGQRLFLARTRRRDAAGGTLRQLRIVSSPFLPQRDCCYVVEASGLRGLRSQDLQQMEDTTSTVTLTAPAAQHRVAQQPTQVGSTGPTESAQTPPAAAAAATAVAATPHSRLPVLSAANVTSPALGTAISASSRAGCGAQMHGGVVQRVQQLV